MATSINNQELLKALTNAGVNAELTTGTLNEPNLREFTNDWFEVFYNGKSVYGGNSSSLAHRALGIYPGSELHVNGQLA